MINSIHSVLVQQFVLWYSMWQHLALLLFRFRTDILSSDLAGQQFRWIAHLESILDMWIKNLDWCMVKLSMSSVADNEKNQRKSHGEWPYGRRLTYSLWKSETGVLSYSWINYSIIYNSVIVQNYICNLVSLSQCKQK